MKAATLSKGIPKDSRVAFVGGTGSGKSTMLDLMMRLLTPAKGQILVDDESLSREIVLKPDRDLLHMSHKVFIWLIPH